MQLRRTARAAFAVALAAPCVAAAAPAAQAPVYTVSRSVPLGGSDKWDYVSFDPATHRIMVAHDDHTDIVDEQTGTVVGKLEGLHSAHGQAVAANGRIYADSRVTRDVTAFDPTSFKAIKTLPAAEDADALIYEPVHQLAVVLEGDAAAATLVDTRTNTIAANIKLGGSPEFAAADGRGAVFVNLADQGQVARLDAGAAKVTAHYDVPGCQSPHGLAMDTATRRLFVSCVNQHLAVLDAESGHVLQMLPIGRGTDAAGFDPVRHLVYSSNGEGTLSVFHEAADGTLTALGDAKTAPGARTMAVDPQSGRVFTVTADIDTTKPVQQTDHGPRYAWKPGSVHLLFLDPPAR